MGVKLLLDKANVPGIRTYEVYRREGGYKAVEKALKEMSTDAICGRGKEEWIKR
jgi:NADH-quinone oxidoreductase subunit F